MFFVLSLATATGIGGGGLLIPLMIVIDTFHNAVETGFEIFARRVAISDNPRQNSLVTTFEENKIKSKINDDKTESDVRIKIGVVIVYIFDRDASGNETKKEIELDEKRLRELKFTATKSNGEVGAYNVITFLQGQEGHLIGDNPGLVDQLFAFLKAM